MSTQTTMDGPQLDTFEARLLAELRREVAAATTTHSSRRTRRVAASAAAVAAAALAGVVLVPGLGTAPAYSVQEGNSGEIVVQIHRPEDAAGLERELARHGVTADVTYLPGLRTCAPGRYEPVDREVGMTVGMGQDLVRVTLPPGAVREGETFVMVWSVETVDDGTAASVEADVTSGPVGPCNVVDTPAR